MIRKFFSYLLLLGAAGVILERERFPLYAEWAPMVIASVLIFLALDILWPEREGLAASQKKRAIN